MNENKLRIELQDTEWPMTGIDHDRHIARAIVFDEDGYFYFVRAERDDDFGQATLIETAGGGVEAGEDLEQAIKRELHEELGVEVELLCKIGVVSDYYNLIHRHNINNYFLCKVKAFGDKALTEDEINDFHLSTLKLRYEEAIKEYEKRSETRLGKLVCNRELPVLKRAWDLLNPDCGMRGLTKKFRYRTGAIVVNDGKMLFVKCKVADYYYMIGGAVKMCETSADCITRELKEEAGISAKVDHLAIVCENFFKGVGGPFDGLDCHALEFYYRMDASPEEIAKCKTINDEGEELVWIPISEFKDHDIKPPFLKEKLEEVILNKNLIHVVQKPEV